MEPRSSQSREVAAANAADNLEADSERDELEEFDRQAIEFSASEIFDPLQQADRKVAAASKFDNSGITHMYWRTIGR